MKVTLYVLTLMLCISCRQKDQLFVKIPATQSKVFFNNSIAENDSINPIDMEFIYNGGGVAVGDFNNDELPDLYFTASQVSNKLYLNEGEFKFRDITEPAGVSGASRWSFGASVIDINNDGWLDIYVCTSILKNSGDRANLLYINQGLNAEGLPTFREMAAAYNLADTGFSVQSAFFDYDNDGDLDMYLVNSKLAQRNSSRFDGGNQEDRRPLTDHLFRNEGSDSLGHPYFRDVSEQAGIHDAGYGLAVSVADLNNDGWKDIFVSNDFYTSDALYINNRNGTFTDRSRQSLKHSSQNSMGNDIADINNDGLPDMITVDMNPEDNFRKKKNMGSNNYFIYQSMMNSGMLLQYVRNTLQLNNGIVADSAIPYPVFSDIAFYSGVAETDWSWSPLFADFDNDGWKDLLITNGYPKDVTDHDFAAFRNRSAQNVTKKELLEQIPQIRVSNYAYRNEGGLKFNNVSRSWGIDPPSFSNGAAYADLDNDGDLDYIVNNINQEAFLFKNELEKKQPANWLRIQFKGSVVNRNGLGATVKLYQKQGLQVFEHNPSRGYLSSIENGLHFGLGASTSIDSLTIIWPDHRKQVLKNPPINKQFVADYTNATLIEKFQQEITPPAFTDITSETGIRFRQDEFDHIDFDVQRLLPKKLSEQGPGLAVADIDGNGLDDLFVPGSAGYTGKFFLQQPDGKFVERELPAEKGPGARLPEMTGSLFFDADMDGDVDLYVCSGSNEFLPQTINYQDRFYLNDGKGNFSLYNTAIPANKESKSCVRAADYDRDGDLDLFIAGRVIPQRYPQPASSYILRNDSKAGVPAFTDVTNQVAPLLRNFGLVCDILWSDFDNDEWPDLVIAGEWMPVRFIKNNKGKFEDLSNAGSYPNRKGWWSSIAPGDFDNDGDIDYVVGNLGENSYYRADSLHPVRMYGLDQGSNKSYIAIPSMYLHNSQGELTEFPAHTRDDIVDHVPVLKKKFLTYQSFGKAKAADLFSDEQRKTAYVTEANFFKSVLMENQGNGQFRMRTLPGLVQLAPLTGMVVDDFDADGNLDIIIAGNDFGGEVGNGRYDALNGVYLAGNGQGEFSVRHNSGLLLPGDQRGLVKLQGAKGYLVAAAQNRGPIQIFRLINPARIQRIGKDITSLQVSVGNGEKRKIERYYGASYLSQSAPIYLAPQ